MENFNAPYLSTSVAEFWRNWHISLTSWFKDYLYIPLGGSRNGKLRTMINKMIVFLVSGLWHGANVTYIVWGGLNGLYQVLGDSLRPLRNRVVKTLHLNADSMGHRMLRMGITFVLVDFAWLFFRAQNMNDAINLIKSMCTKKNIYILFDGSIFNCGLDISNFRIMMLSIGILMFADYCKIKHICIRKIIASQDYWFRWLFISMAILAIMLFGIWGTQLDKNAFIYFQF